MPSPGPINVLVDLSHFNTVTDFQQIKKDGLLGIFHKATQGAGYVDPRFVERRKAIGDAGLLFGAYHFGTEEDPAGQVNHFLSVVDPTANPDTLLVLDFEKNTGGASMSLGQAETFVQRIHDATGHYPGLYSGNDLQQALTQARITSPSQTILSQCWLWIAQYRKVQAPQIPSIWGAWTLWQYTDGTNGNGPYAIPGIQGNCDRDLFNGGEDQLRQFWASHGDQRPVDGV